MAVVKIDKDELYPYYIICSKHDYSDKYDIPDNILNAYQKAQKKFEKARTDLGKAMGERYP